MNIIHLGRSRATEQLKALERAWRFIFSTMYHLTCFRVCVFLGECHYVSVAEPERVLQSLSNTSFVGSCL